MKKHTEIFEHKGIRCEISIIFDYMENMFHKFHKVHLKQIDGIHEESYVIKDNELSLHVERAEEFCEKILTERKMEEQRLKVELELHVCGDGRTFLNFWNYKTGDDVVSEVKDGKLYMGDDEKETEVSLQEFINQVKDRFK